MNQTKTHRLGVTLIAALGLVGMMLISSPLTIAKAEKKSAKPKGVPVKVVSIKPQTIQLWKQYSGSIVAVDSAQIRPQVSGRITKILFQDGQYVQKGDVLIIIDPRPYQAALKQAKASLATAKTQVDFAQKELERAKELVKKRAVAKRLLDERQNNYQVAQAAVLNAQAQVETAEINVDYAHIKAPISGIVSRAEITEGNLVQSGSNAPVLTSIVTQDKVYIDFEVDEKTYIDSIQQTPTNNIKTIPVRIQISGLEKIYEGNMHSFDNRIDPSTGTIRGRALFDNNDGKLLPGMTISVEMGQATSQNNKQILISEKAIGTDQDRKFVYIVSPENKATYREVKIGPSIAGQRIILNGLKQGDKVISQGLMRIRPNALVSPTFINNNKLAQDKKASTPIAN